MSGTLNSGRREVPSEDKIRFWEARAAGISIKEACKIAGIHYNTGQKWDAKRRRLNAELAVAQLNEKVADVKASRGGQRVAELRAELDTIAELPPVIPYERLSERAKRGWDDFDYFRRVYLGRVPSPWQVEAAYRIVEYLESEEKEFLVLNCPPGAGKALALDTPLKTPSGWTTIGDVQPGQFVIGADGQPVMVIAKSEVFYDHDCFTVTTDDGYSVVADADHLWPVRLDGEGKNKRTGTPDRPGKTGPKTSGVNGIRNQTTRFLARPRSKRPELQVTKPLVGTWTHLPVDPYLLGVWLGDGDSASGGISCHTDDQPEMRLWFEQSGYKTVQYLGRQKFGVYGFTKDLRRAGVFKNKHIPNQYLNATYADRLALLQGLIDTDGYVSETGYVEFCTTSPQLAAQTRELILSLGVKSSYKESRATLYGKDCGPRWRICFYLKDCARLTRKQIRTKNAVRTPNRYLTIAPTETVPTQCIQVEGGLFLAGEGMLVTHNSTLFHDVAVWCIVRNRAIRVLIGSISQTLAKMYSRRIRETLERPTRLIADPELVRKGLAVDAEGCLAHDYGRFKPTASGSLWRAEEFIVEQLNPGMLENKEPTVSAYGIDSEFIGHRADLCLFDDVASPENAKESTSRDRLLERWDSMAEARCDPGGLVAVIGQRLGSGDLYAHCLNKITYDELDEDDDLSGEDATVEERLSEPVKKQKYHHITYKAYYEELDTGPKSRSKKASPWPEGPLLDPVRLPWKDLSYIKYNQPNKYRIVYQQEDIDSDYQLVDRAMLTGGVGLDGVQYQGCIDKDRQPGSITRHLAHPLISIISVDPSPSQFWGVIWTLVQPDQGLYHVVDLERVKLTAEELLGWQMTTGEYTGILEEWVQRADRMGYPISHIVVEVNAAQRFLLAHDFVRRWQATRNVQVIPHTTSRNKLDENLGLEALIPPIVRSGSLRLPTMSGNWKTLALVEELTSWTRDKKKGTDLAMALWFTVLHAPRLSAPKLPPRMWRPSFLTG